MTVIFDAYGNNIGGGSRDGGAYLPPAARVFFQIDNGMRPIPFYKAASRSCPSYRRTRGNPRPGGDVTRTAGVRPLPLKARPAHTHDPNGWGQTLAAGGSSRADT
jgi:hypothetical protein